MTAFETLLSDSLSPRSYLVVLEPYDPVLQAVTTLRFSDRGFVTEPTDDPPDTYYPPRLVTPLNFQRELFSAGRIGARSIPGFGMLALNNADGGLDEMTALAYDGRRVRVYIGSPDFRLDEYGLIFDGTAEQLEFDDAVVRVRLRDLRSRLDVDLQRGGYGGTGGADGRAGLAARPKPLCFGRVLRVEPVLVDPSALLYQVHDGPIADLDAVYDNGVPLARTGGAPVAGQFSVDAATGAFTLGASPAGRITVDVRGDAAGDGYTDTAAGLVRRIAGRRTDLVDPDDFDLSSFDALDAEVPAPLGVHVPDEASALEVLDRIVESVGAHVGFNRAGRLAVGRVAAPTEPAAAAFGAREILDIERVAVARPAWRRKIGYGRYWSTLDAAAVAGAVDDETRADLGEPYRYAMAEDPAVRATHLLSDELVDDTALTFQADAQAEAVRRLALFGVGRDGFKVTLKTQPFALDLGQTVRVTYPRHGLAGGRLLIIVGMTEDASINQVTLDLWG